MLIQLRDNEKSEAKQTISQADNNLHLFVGDALQNIVHIQMKLNNFMILQEYLDFGEIQASLAAARKALEESVGLMSFHKSDSQQTSGVSVCRM